MLGDPLVIGLGNRLRGDDGIGLEVARTLAGRRPDLRVIEHEREPVDLIGLWTASSGAIVVSCARGGGAGPDPPLRRLARDDAARGDGVASPRVTRSTSGR